MKVRRLLYLGMSGPFSVAPLLRLIEASDVAVQVAHPETAALSGRELPVRRPLTDCRAVAADRGLPVVAITREWQPRLAETGCDLLLAACWPWRIPMDVLEAFPAGAFNLHPSLLPRYRGPDPLFWQLRDAVEQTGVTLHRLAAEIDAGPVVGQRALALRPGADEGTLARRLGHIGGGLALGLVHDVRADRAAAQPQKAAQASYQRAPRRRDFRVPVRWSARRAYTFMRGVQRRGHPFEIVAANRSVRVRAACGMAEGRRLSTLPWSRDGDHLAVQFADGVVVTRT